MTMTTLEVTCRDPIVSRDSRPFGIKQGNRMRTAGWPLPSVIAGSLRTLLGKVAGREFSEATATDLLQVEVAGGFPMTADETTAANGKLYLPAPDDCVVHPERGPLRARPLQYEGGCNWPAKGLLPVVLAEDAAEDFKPRECPAWWPLDAYVAWLTGGPVSFHGGFLNAPSTEFRTHVQLRSETGAAEEGMLFTSAALPLSHLARWNARAEAPLDRRFAPVRLALRVTADNWATAAAAALDRLHPLGGERRLAHWKTTRGGPWDCPESVANSLAKSKRVRMTLATPAIFSRGWKPGWLNDQLTGSPWKEGPVMKLVGVCIERWRAVSGWSLAALPGQPRGPKPIKRMVPAGGVYFFEAEQGAASLAQRWLHPVSDDPQDRRDGFGLAAWGTW